MRNLVLLIAVILAEVKSYTQDALNDQVLSLPRATPIRSNQFSGFLDITPTKNLHYMYYESENDPATDPIIFWTNGGPGCSGLLGLFTEFGPWRPIQNGSLVPNPWSWTKLANLVFLEQPVGVGFSYGTDPDELSAYNDYRASIDNLLTIRTFFSRFPERAKQPFYVASESYGGHYIPQWTLQLFADTKLRETFKGMIVGNPFTSYASGSIAMTNVIWGLQMIPQPLWDAYLALGCDSLDSSALHLIQTSPYCFQLSDIIFSLAGPVNPYALDFPVCTLKNEAIPSYAYSYYYYYYSQMMAGDDFFPEHDDGSNNRHNKQSNRIKVKENLKLGFSQQARTLLKIHDRIRESDLLKNSLEKYRSAHPEHVELIESLSSGSLASSEVSPDSTPRKPSRRSSNGGGGGRNNPQRTSRVLSEIDTFDAYNVTYDPCTADYTRDYLSDPEVQAALHVLRPSPTNSSQMISITWSECDDYVNGIWSFSDYLSDTTDLYSTMFNHEDKPEGFKMLVFSGDSDGVCATIGTQNWIYNITGSEVVSLYKPWYYNDSVYSTQQGGYLTQFSGLLSFATVHHAGHEVPAYQPEKALELFRQYLEGTLFYGYSETSTSTNEGGAGGGGGNTANTMSEVVIIVLIVAAVLAVVFGCIACYRSHQARKAALSEFVDEDFRL